MEKGDYLNKSKRGNNNGGGAGGGISGRRETFSIIGRGTFEEPFQVNCEMCAV